MTGVGIRKHPRGHAYGSHISYKSSKSVDVDHVLLSM